VGSNEPRAAQHERPKPLQLLFTGAQGLSQAGGRRALRRARGDRIPCIDMAPPVSVASGSDYAADPTPGEGPVARPFAAAG
jgi:hypothetical protein